MERMETDLATLHDFAPRAQAMEKTISDTLLQLEARVSLLEETMMKEMRSVKHSVIHSFFDPATNNWWEKRAHTLLSEYLKEDKEPKEPALKELLKVIGIAGKEWDYDEFWEKVASSVFDYCRDKRAKWSYNIRQQAVIHHVERKVGGKINPTVLRSICKAAFGRKPTDNDLKFATQRLKEWVREQRKDSTSARRRRRGQDSDDEEEEGEQQAEEDITL